MGKHRLGDILGGENQRRKYFLNAYHVPNKLLSAFTYVNLFKLYSHLLECYLWLTFTDMKAKAQKWYIMFSNSQS